MGGNKGGSAASPQVVRIHYPWTKTESVAWRGDALEQTGTRRERLLHLGFELLATT